MKPRRYRIILDKHVYKIQVKYFLFWKTIQRPEDLDNKDFGGDMCFTEFLEADKYLSRMTFLNSRLIKVIKEFKA